MQKNLSLMLEDGSMKEFAFRANGTTSLRFEQVFSKNLMQTITGFFRSLNETQMSDVMNIYKAMGDSNEVRVEELDPATLQLLIPLVGSGELQSVSELAYIMNQQAEAKSPSDLMALSYEGYFDWLDQFDSMTFLQNATAIIDVYMNNTKSTSEPKKEPAQLSES